MTEQKMNRERARCAMIFLAEADKASRYGKLALMLPFFVDDPGDLMQIGAEMAYIKINNCLPPWGRFVDGARSTHGGHVGFFLDRHLALGMSQ